MIDYIHHSAGGAELGTSYASLLNSRLYWKTLTARVIDRTLNCSESAVTLSEIIYANSYFCNVQMLLVYNIITTYVYLQPLIQNSWDPV